MSEILSIESPVHQRILAFLKAASLDASRWGKGGDVPDNYRKRYETDFPKIPQGINEPEFIAVLEKLGAFQYYKGGDGGLDFRSYANSITEYADFFMKNPHLMSKVSSTSHYVAKYRGYGQMACMWMLYKDLGL
jgi:hypothetical protein